MFASWKKSENARSTAPCSATGSSATAAASAVARARPATHAAREQPDPLLELEELAPLLLDQHAAEQIPE